MRALVTGGAGFIGRWVVKRLLELGHTAQVIDNLSGGRVENLHGLRSADGRPPEFVEGDVRDRPLLADLLNRGPGVCIHLAANISVQSSLDNPTEDFAVNVAGTHGLLEECRRTETKLVLVSTCMVYAAAVGNMGLNEDSPVRPLSPYAGGKLAAESLCRAYHQAYGTPVVILRPFNTYGPYQRLDGEGGVIPVFLRRAQLGQPLRVYGDGRQTRDFLYVEDCADFIVRATLSDRAVGRVINGASGLEVRIRDLAETIAGRTGAIEYAPSPHPRSEIARLKGDHRLAGELLDWHPTVGLSHGLRLTSDWLRQNVGG
ncbi:MAG TPA: NAD-dependent epimerase/dehydratase family protein [Bacillota bacterium]|jgi:nucleoside-diphosphate-sugar epimerase